MKFQKKIISDLKFCYCVAPLQHLGKPHFLVASEKEYPCLLFDAQGNFTDTIWEKPGGTMSAVQLPGIDSAFLATHKFYSPNNSKEAEIVLTWFGNGNWHTRTIIRLPCIHRFDILTRDGINYLIICCIKSDYQFSDDWRFPGKTYVCKLPDNLLSLQEPLEIKEIMSGMLKNHGYSRDKTNGVMSGIITCENGVYRFTPPSAKPDDSWKITQLISDPVSDAVLADFDGCGKKELLVLSPFHGDTIAIYKLKNETYEKIWEYEKKTEFAHAICCAEIEGRIYAFVGHRKGKRDLLQITWEHNNYQVTAVDHNIGPANVLYSFVNGKHILLSANREINEVAYYTITGKET